LGERPSANSTVEDTAARSVASSSSILCGGGQQSASHLTGDSSLSEDRLWQGTFRSPRMAEGELLNLFSVLPLRLLQPSLGVSCHVRQAPGVLLGHISRPTHLHKLALKKGNPPSKGLCLSTSRGQHRSALHLYSRHPLLGLPLSQGRPVLLIPDN
jgi:hypothetical protein